MDADPITLVPGSAEWLREMTASKVAAVVGLSPWQSRFSLWYEMAGAVERGDPSRQMERGHYLEDAVARWLGDQHALHLQAGLCWRNRSRPWQVASPDRLAYPASLAGSVANHGQATAVVEVKTAADYEKWGPDGSDEIPPYYRVQVVWQCDTLGLPRGYVGVLLPRLELRGYVIEPAPGEAEWLREEARAFLDSLAAQEPPDVDNDSHTYNTLRALNPRIEQDTVQVAPELARAYARAVLGLRVAEDEHTLRRSQVAQHMGLARYAEYDGRRLALRKPGPTGSPYVQAGTAKVLAAIANEEEPNEQ